MIESAAQIVQAMINGVWNMAQIQVPGFNFTFAGYWIGALLIGISFSLLRLMFGFGGGGSSSSYRSRSSRNAKISKERKHDEK